MTAEGQRISVDTRGRLSVDKRGRASKGGNNKGKVSGDGMFADDLPLLSLAAQPGIVFAKMPPSMASSPAVSVTEGSMSRHLLRGTLRRSDITQVGRQGRKRGRDAMAGCLFPFSASSASAVCIHAQAAGPGGVCVWWSAATSRRH